MKAHQELQQLPKNLLWTSEPVIRILWQRQNMVIVQIQNLWVESTLSILKKINFQIMIKMVKVKINWCYLLLLQHQNLNKLFKQNLVLKKLWSKSCRGSLQREKLTNKGYWKRNAEKVLLQEKRMMVKNHQNSLRKKLQIKN